MKKNKKIVLGLSTLATASAVVSFLTINNTNEVSVYRKNIKYYASISNETDPANIQKLETWFQGATSTNARLAIYTDGSTYKPSTMASNSSQYADEETSQGYDNGAFFDKSRPVNPNTINQQNSANIVFSYPNSRKVIDLDLSGKKPEYFTEFFNQDINRSHVVKRSVNYSYWNYRQNYKQMAHILKNWWNIKPSEFIQKYETDSVSFMKKLGLIDSTGNHNFFISNVLVNKNNNFQTIYSNTSSSGVYTHRFVYYSLFEKYGTVPSVPSPFQAFSVDDNFREYHSGSNHTILPYKKTKTDATGNQIIDFSNVIANDNNGTLEFDITYVLNNKEKTIRHYLKFNHYEANDNLFTTDSNGNKNIIDRNSFEFKIKSYEFFKPKSLGYGKFVPTPGHTELLVNGVNVFDKNNSNNMSFRNNISQSSTSQDVYDLDFYMNTSNLNNENPEYFNYSDLASNGTWEEYAFLYKNGKVIANNFLPFIRYKGSSKPLILDDSNINSLGAKYVINNGSSHTLGNWKINNAYLFYEKMKSGVITFKLNSYFLNKSFETFRAHTQNNYFNPGAFDIYENGVKIDYNSNYYLYPLVFMRLQNNIFTFSNVKENPIDGTVTFDVSANFVNIMDLETGLSNKNVSDPNFIKLSFSGFKKIGEEIKNDMNALKPNLSLKDINNKQNRLAESIPDGEIQVIYNGSPFTTYKGITIKSGSLNIVKNNTSRNIVVSFILEKSGVEESVTLSLTGFQSVQDAQNIADLKDINTLVPNIRIDVKDKADTLPSNVSNNNLIVTNSSNQTLPLNGVSVDFNSINFTNHNNSQGNVRVSFDLVKGTQRVSVSSRLIEGFLTTTQANNRDDLALINGLSNLSGTAPLDVLPSQINSSQINILSNGNPLPAGVSWQITNLSPDNNAGTLGVQFTLRKGTQTSASKNVQITNLWTTTKQEDKDDANLLANLKLSLEARVANASNFLAEEVADNDVKILPQGQSTLPANVEILNPTYLKSNQNQSIIVTFTLKVRRQQEAGIQKTVGGFKSLSQAQNEANQQAVDTLYNSVIANITDKATKLPNDITNTDLTVEDGQGNTLPLANGISVVNISWTNRNNSNGTITVAFQLQKGSQLSQIKTVDFTGLKTTQQDTDEKDQQILDAINNLSATGPTNTLPNEVKDSQINILSNNTPLPNGVTFEITTKTPHNDQGTLELIFTLRKGTRTLTGQTATISNLLTTQQDTDNKDLTFLQGIRNNFELRVSDKNRLAETVSDEEIDILPNGSSTLPAGVSIENKVFVKSNANQSISATFTIIKGTQRIENVTANATGFKSITDATNENDLKAVNKAFGTLKVDITNKTNILPSAVTNQDASITNDQNQSYPQNGITVDQLTWSQRNDDAGTISISFRLLKGSQHSQLYNQVITGLKTNQNVTDEQDLSTLNGLNNLTGMVTPTTTLPNDVSDGQIAILNDNNPLPTGVSVTFTNKTPNNDNGTLEVTFTLTKGTQSVTNKVVTISGLKTTQQQKDEDDLAELNRLKETLELKVDNTSVLASSVDDNLISIVDKTTQSLLLANQATVENVVYSKNDATTSIEATFDLVRGTQRLTGLKLTKYGFQSLDAHQAQLDKQRVDTIFASLAHNIADKATILPKDLKLSNINFTYTDGSAANTAIPNDVQIVQFETSNVDNEHGTITFSVVLMKNGQLSAKYTKNETGLKTNQDVTNEQDDALLATLTALTGTAPTNILPTIIDNGQITILNNGQPLPSGVTFTIDSRQNDNVAGTITLILTLQKGTRTLTNQNVTITGLWTSQNQTDKEDLAAITALQNNLVANVENKDRLASKVLDTDIKILPQGETKLPQGVTLEDKTYVKDDARRLIDVTFTIVKGTQRISNVSKQVTGFKSQTQAQQEADKADVDAQFALIQVTIPSKETKLPSSINRNDVIITNGTVTFPVDGVNVSTFNITNQNNDAGSLTISFVLSKNGQLSNPYTVDITGLMTSAQQQQQQDQDVVNAALNDLQLFINDKDRLPSLVPIGDILIRHKNGTQYDTSIEFIEKSFVKQDDVTGSITISFKIRKNTVTSNTVELSIDQLKTAKQAQLQADQAQLDGLRTVVRVDKKQLPTDVDTTEITITELNKQTLPTNIEVQNLQITNTNNTQGTLTISYNLVNIVSSATRTLTNQVITGFVDAKSNQNAIIHKLITGLYAKTKIFIRDKETLLPSEVEIRHIYAKPDDAAELPSDVGVNSIRFTNINDQAGTITVSLNLYSKVNGEKSDILTADFTGLKSQVDIDRANNQKLLDRLDRALEVVATDKTKLPSELTTNELAIQLISGQSLDPKIQFIEKLITATNDEAGTLTLSFKIQVGAGPSMVESQTMTLNASGLLNKAQKDALDSQKILNDLINNEQIVVTIWSKQMLPTSVKKQHINIFEVGKTNLPQSVTLYDLELLDRDNNAGTIKVRYILERLGAKTSPQTVSFSGLWTMANKKALENQQILDELYKKLDLSLNNYDQFPSEVDTKADVIIENVSLPSGVEAQIEKRDVNDDNGTLKVLITLVKGQQKSLTFAKKFSNLKAKTNTIDPELKRRIEYIARNIAPFVKNNKLPSEMTKNDFEIRYKNFDELEPDVSVANFSIQSPDDEKGTLKLSFEIHIGAGSSNTLTFFIDSLKTTSNINNQTTDEYLNSVLNNTVAQVADKTLFPSKVQRNNVNIHPAFKTSFENGVSVDENTFAIIDADDGEGTLKVKFRLKQGNVFSQFKEIEITKLAIDEAKKDQLNKQAVDDALSKITIKKTSDSLNDITINDLVFYVDNKKLDSTFKFRVRDVEIVKRDSAKNEITVEYIVQKADYKSEKQTRTIGGFVNIAGDVDKIINDIETELAKPEPNLDNVKINVDKIKEIISKNPDVADELKPKLQAIQDKIDAKLVSTIDELLKKLAVPTEVNEQAKIDELKAQIQKQVDLIGNTQTKTTKQDELNKAANHAQTFNDNNKKLVDLEKQITDQSIVKSQANEQIAAIEEGIKDLISPLKEPLSTLLANLKEKAKGLKDIDLLYKELHERIQLIDGQIDKKTISKDEVEDQLKHVEGRAKGLKLDPDKVKISNEIKQIRDKLKTSNIKPFNNTSKLVWYASLMAGSGLLAIIALITAIKLASKKKEN